MTVQAIAGLRSEAADMRRGACPTLGQPMRTGDGLLARLRPEDCRLTLAQLRALAHAASEFGNGIVEVTARGSLQIRGLRPETVRPLEEAVFNYGIMPATGLMVEVPPLAGIDPEELIDPRPIAQEIRQLVAAHRPLLVLAPKLAVTVDGGGRLHLGAVIADVRLTAIDEQRFLLALGGDNASARKVAVVPSDRVAPAVLRVLEAVAALGPAARGREVDLAALDGLHDPAASDIAVPTQVRSFLGVQAMQAGHGFAAACTLGIGFPYRQARAADLIAFLDDVEISGLSDIRLSPGHGIVLTGLHHAQASRAEDVARRHGFWTSPHEPRARISLCAGRSGCASAHFDTRAAAEAVSRHAPLLLDGSISVHLSGCQKGCAHPSAAAVTLVGAPSGYALVVNGSASHSPALYIAANDLETALARLASLVAGAKEADEEARDCLARIGLVAIVAALDLP